MPTDVSFDCASLRIAGHVYSPDDLQKASGPQSSMAHPASGVKEQTGCLYAERLAKHGFIALAFDAALKGRARELPEDLDAPFRAASAFHATRHCAALICAR